MLAESPTSGGVCARAALAACGYQRLPTAPLAAQKAMGVCGASALLTAPLPAHACVAPVPRQRHPARRQCVQGQRPYEQFAACDPPEVRSRQE